MSTRGKDEFGFRLGTKRAKAAQLLKYGTTQAEIEAAIGYPHYNMLKDAERWGHLVVRDGNRIWLVHASDIGSVKPDIDKIKQRDDLTETEKSALIKRRIGQAEFRRSQIHLWGGCAVTGCTAEAVLEACHIKPWGEFRSERLEVENGLCLTANLHKLFDAGLITFEDDGRMLVSSQLPQKDQALLMLEGQRLRKTLIAQQRSYLRFHRENVYRRRSAVRGA